MKKGELTRQRIIEITTALVNKKGFANTSISDIIEATGVKKGNLYFHFQGKEALGLAILEAARDQFLEFLENCLRGKSPRERLACFFDGVLEKHRATGFVGGCIFGNTALEMSDLNPKYSQFIKEVFNRWIDLLQGVITEGQNLGEISKDLPPRILAKQVVACIEGGIMMSRVSKDEGDLADCLHGLKKWLGL